MFDWYKGSVSQQHQEEHMQALMGGTYLWVSQENVTIPTVVICWLADETMNHNAKEKTAD